MDLQDPKIRPYHWDIFASEVSYKATQGQVDIAQAKVDAGKEDICPMCGQPIANKVPLGGGKVPAGQLSPLVVCDHSTALVQAQDSLTMWQGSVDHDWDTMTAWKLGFVIWDWTFSMIRQCLISARWFCNRSGRVMRIGAWRPMPASRKSPAINLIRQMLNIKIF